MRNLFGHFLTRVLAYYSITMMVAPAVVGPRLAHGADFARTALFDGERSEDLNTWGGPFGNGTSGGVLLQSEVVCHGRRAAQIDLGTILERATPTFQMFASGFARSPEYRQTRNLARFASLELAMSNHTGRPLCVVVEVKDYRDSDDHRGLWRFSLGASSGWREVRVPLAGAMSSWQQIGQPDFTCVSSLQFLFQADDAPIEGKVFLDDVVLVEPGGPVPVDRTPLDVLVERLAHRSWDGLWSARSRTHGLIPNNSYQVTDAGLNTTAAVLWMLPAAVRCGWIDAKSANEYVAVLLETLDRLVDEGRYLPPRNVDWVTLRTSLFPEESSVDAAFLSLALYQYKSLQAGSDELRAKIDRVQNRLQFDAFSSDAGWRMAYRYASPYSREGFTGLVYDGYTNENKVVSLAAHLSDRHHVDVASHWNCDVNRVRAAMVDPAMPPAVHSMREYRAPFTQALLNLFVDVRSRGRDSFPNVAMATNPWTNFVDYQRQVMNCLSKRGRPWLVQPDAGDDGSLGNYQQFSLYEDFGQSDLFMPWSVSFALLAGVDGSEKAFRFLLEHDLHGPLGLADSAHWTTGEAEPYAVTARHDFWNTALCTMALLEHLEGDGRSSRRFAALPAVRAALDNVFPRASSTTVAAGKASQSGIAQPADAGL